MKRGEDKVDEYAKAMQHELEANAHKGDWLLDTDTGQPLDDETLVWELIYHLFKLIAAILKGNKQAILHYAADVGNCAWFIADKHTRARRGQGQRIAAALRRFSKLYSTAKFNYHERRWEGDAVYYTEGEPTAYRLTGFGIEKAKEYLKA